MLKKIRQRYQARLKPKIIQKIYGQGFYRRFLRPFDRLQVRVQPMAAMSGDDVPLNKLCCFSDSRNPLWGKGLPELGFPAEMERFHRKVWEFCQLLYGLRQLKRLTPQAHVLDISCGHEELLFFLSNKVRQVTGIDLFAESFIGSEDASDVLARPEKYSPMFFPPERLSLQRMDALHLEFPDETFDVAFSLSSLEHYGRRRDKLRALQEMKRVLKPGGIAALTTELIVNRLGWRRDFFRIAELQSLIGDSGLILIEPFQLCLEEEFANQPLALPMGTYVLPHLILRLFHTIFTSLAIFMQKEPSPDSRRNAVSGDEADCSIRFYRHLNRIEIHEAPAQVAANQEFTITMTLANAGDSVWYVNPRNRGQGPVAVDNVHFSPSHIVRLGVWVVDGQGQQIPYPISRFDLPEDILPGGALTLRLHFQPLRRKGNLALHLDLVKEFSFWFSQRGSREIILPLRVV